MFHVPGTIVDTEDTVMNKTNFCSIGTYTLIRWIVNKGLIIGCMSYLS